MDDVSTMNKCHYSKFTCFDQIIQVCYLSKSWTKSADFFSGALFDPAHLNISLNSIEQFKGDEDVLEVSTFFNFF